MFHACVKGNSGSWQEIQQLDGKTHRIGQGRTLEPELMRLADGGDVEQSQRGSQEDSVRSTCHSKLVSNGKEIRLSLWFF